MAALINCECPKPRHSHYPFSPQSFDLDGHRLSYIDEGEGRAIVMLHGNPSWSYYYRNLVALLQDSYRVIVPDHMGCGYSDKPQDYPYCLATHILNLKRLLDGLGVDKFSLVMHDWGGAIGMGLAVQEPERIETLVVSNTAAFRSKMIPWRIKICRTPMLGDILVRGLNVFAGAAPYMAVVKTLESEVARAYLAPYDSWRNRIAVLRFVQDIPLSEKDASWQKIIEIEKGLEMLKDRPMKILWGGRDFCFTGRFYQEWCRRFPRAEHHYFPKAGHWLLEDAFAEVSPLLSDFFARNLHGPR